MLDAAGPLTSCCHYCQALSWSHDTAATNTSRLTCTSSAKMSQKVNKLLNKAEINKSELHSKILGLCCKY